ncbi:uncharacterized protein LAESUDRAFT_732482 [Laetiporus sulphureus 93-53]|uniref:DUF6533 domain-containing protein n=1 Tax=Laetiporus sulphureus 93-53 TaxID=1314785 RepID=A0A165B4J0_9APHY|nr:uncharacterized protein LAESUDRAFT_732482 [Laetiporus sulphureus 93-53]KZT00218.1 hypothetical protein LAESUDRAFT_732482 [Laetiporus sulphureus 93-53]
MFYEHVITLGQEVKFMWSNRTPSTILFFINRLAALVYGTSSVVSLINVHSTASCEMVSNILYGSDLAISIVSGVVTLLRVYAITSRDWRPTIPLALLFVAMIGFNTVFAFVNISYEVIVLGPTAVCNGFTQDSFANTSSKLSIASLVVSMVANIAVIGIIWRTLASSLSLTSPTIFPRKSSLAILLLRDGTIQFITLLLMNVVGEVLSIADQQGQYIFNNLQPPLVAILVSRMLLNIHETAMATRGEQSSTPSFVRSGHGVQTEAHLPDLIIPSDSLNSIIASGMEARRSMARMDQSNAIIDEGVIAGPSAKVCNHENAEAPESMTTERSGETHGEDLERVAINRFEEEDDWETDYYDEE